MWTTHPSTRSSQSIQAELDKKGAELGVTFDYADYTKNGQADSTTLNQIAADLIADGVDVIIPDCNARRPDYAGCDRGKCDSGGISPRYPIPWARGLLRLAGRSRLQHHRHLRRAER